jgi:hypothetical protein
MFSIAKTERVTEREGTTAFAALCGGEDVLRDAGRPLLRGGDEPPDNATVAIRAGRRPRAGRGDEGFVNYLFLCVDTQLKGPCNQRAGLFLGLIAV